MVLPISTNIMVYPARSQFQAGAPCRGSSCCTDTCIQMIAEFYLRRTYSLSAVRKLAQSRTSFNEASCTGINQIEALNALKLMGLSHYRVATGVDASDINRMKNIGPVIVGVYYGSYPNKAVGGCSGVRAEIGGRTDCGFRGAHAVLAIGGAVHKVGSTSHSDIFVRDPDHRVNMPRYDRIHLADLNTAMRNLPRYTAFSRTFAIYPTRRK